MSSSRLRVLAVAGDDAIEMDVTPHPSCSCASWRGAAVRAHSHRSLDVAGTWCARLVPGVMELSWGRAYRRLAVRRARDLLDAGKEAAPWPHPIA